MLVRSRGGCAGPTWPESFLAWRSSGHLVIPLAMKGPSPRAGDGALNHRTQAALFQKGAHVYMNQEKANGDQGHTGMNENGDVTRNVPAPGDRFGKPQHHAGEQQEDDAVDHAPEEKLLPPVEAAHGRELVVIILNVELNAVDPNAIVVVDRHVPPPLCKSPEQRGGEKQTKAGAPNPVRVCPSPCPAATLQKSRTARR